MIPRLTICVTLCRWKFETETICYKGKHGTLTWVLGIPGLVIIAFLCPVVTAIFLARNKKRLHTPDFLARWGSEGLEKAWWGSLQTEGGWAEGWADCRPLPGGTGSNSQPSAR